MGTLLHENRSIILTGDLNYKNVNWNNRMTARNDMLLNLYISERDITVVATLTSMHYLDNTNHRPDVLNVAVLKNITHSQDLCTLDEGPKGLNSIILAPTSKRHIE